MPPLSQRPLVFIDTETTGLDPEQNDVIQIAILRDNQEYVRKLKMERPENAHPRALEVNGYSEEAWADALDPKEVWTEIAELGLLEDCIVAGHNVRFDVAFIEKAFARHGIDQRIDYHLFDTVTLALVMLKEIVDSVSLLPTCVALGIPLQGGHDALADARLSKAVWELFDDGLEWMPHRGHVKERLQAWTAAGKPMVWSDSKKTDITPLQPTPPPRHRPRTIPLPPRR